MDQSWDNHLVIGLFIKVNATFELYCGGVKIEKESWKSAFGTFLPSGSGHRQEDLGNVMDDDQDMKVKSAKNHEENSFPLLRLVPASFWVLHFLVAGTNLGTVRQMLTLKREVFLSGAFIFFFIRAPVILGYEDNRHPFHHFSLAMRLSS